MEGPSGSVLLALSGELDAFIKRWRADVKWETMCASGPGCRHVNKTESAVRVTHLPTGMQGPAAEETPQFRNCKLALARLASKLSELEQRWQAQ